MTNAELISLAPYGLPKAGKARLYREQLTELTELHRQSCPPYARLLEALDCPPGAALTEERVPMLPVSLFKELELRSVPEDRVFKTLTSSGTTGQKVSKIVLDEETAGNQQQVLSKIVGDFIGPERLPLLILDSRTVLRDRRLFSARGAGILGFSIFGAKSCYALDEHMELDLEKVRAFLEANARKKILLFGFTFMIWKHVVLELERRGEGLEIPEGILIHGGGWKKLADQAVSAEDFRDRVRRSLGNVSVHDYYGMAEQTGCIYMECPCGHLHASVWSDVLFRRPSDYGICAPGEPGVIEVVSPLPRSYPGHALLTEDMGVLLGEDDCPCGRLGKYFTITGRIPKAEVRGCSDTYEG